MEKYGKTTAEADAEKLFQCRQIVTEILNFGVSEFQKRQIIKLLACELESVNDMKSIVNIINGINIGCNESECLLLGGETAEMPIIYKDKDFDLAGFSVGIIENDIFPKNMEEGDLIYGIESSGVHSNGFSLINKILETKEYNIEELMTPTKIYVKDLNKLKEKYKNKIKGFAHITGGGLIDNIPRIINEGYNMNINKFWKIPDIFKWIYSNSNMKASDMLKTYNCGIGMVIIFDKNTKIDIFDELIELGNIIKSKDYKINYNKIIFN